MVNRVWVVGRNNEVSKPLASVRELTLRWPRNNLPGLPGRSIRSRDRAVESCRIHNIRIPRVYSMVTTFSTWRPIKLYRWYLMPTVIEIDNTCVGTVVLNRAINSKGIAHIEVDIEELNHRKFTEETPVITAIIRHIGTTII